MFYALKMIKEQSNWLAVNTELRPEKCVNCNEQSMQ